jgi:hypothetical protein
VADANRRGVGLATNSIVQSEAIALEDGNNSRLSHAQGRGLELLHIGVTVRVLGLALSQPSHLPSPNVPRPGNSETWRGS